MRQGEEGGGSGSAAGHRLRGRRRRRQPATCSHRLKIKESLTIFLGGKGERGKSELTRRTVVCGSWRARKETRGERGKEGVLRLVSARHSGGKAGKKGRTFISLSSRKGAEKKRGKIFPTHVAFQEGGDQRRAPRRPQGKGGGGEKKGKIQSDLFTHRKKDRPSSIPAPREEGDQVPKGFDGRGGKNSSSGKGKKMRRTSSLALHCVTGGRNV